mmetsp:Transcript_32299/g.32660  ORF Transcript_32299/g.32660 Transcript_32299/m.32660 type:complete len:156 (+) Transcript_32299:511-978(+)
MKWNRDGIHQSFFFGSFSNCYCWTSLVSTVVCIVVVVFIVHLASSQWCRVANNYETMDVSNKIVWNDKKYLGSLPNTPSMGPLSKHNSRWESRVIPYACATTTRQDQTTLPTTIQNWNGREILPLLIPTQYNSRFCGVGTRTCVSRINISRICGI